jgi:hypothetical protein
MGGHCEVVTSFLILKSSGIGPYQFQDNVVWYFIDVKGQNMSSGNEGM